MPPKLAILSMALFPIVSLLADWWEEANIFVEDSNGSNLYAVTQSVKVCRILYRRGLDASHPINLWGNVLVLAVVGNNVEVVKFLVNTAHVDVNLVFENALFGCALSAAIEMELLELVKCLVQECKADVNIQIAGRNADHTPSPLVAAVNLLESEILKYLVYEAKADVNMQIEYGLYGSLLSYAVYRGDLVIFESLVNEAGADVNMLLRNGRVGSALACAAGEGRLDYAEFLILKGADVNMQLVCGEYGSALAAAAAGSNDPRVFRVLKYLVEDAKADVNMRLESGRYADALAAAAGENLCCVKFLVEEAGAEIVLLSNEEDSGRLDPMAAAKGGNRLRIVEYLERRLKGLPTDDLDDSEHDFDSYTCDGHGDAVNDDKDENELDDWHKDRNEGEDKNKDEHSNQDESYKKAKTEGNGT